MWFITKLGIKQKQKNLNISHPGFLICHILARSLLQDLRIPAKNISFLTYIFRNIYTIFETFSFFTSKSKMKPFSHLFHKWTTTLRLREVRAQYFKVQDILGQIFSYIFPLSLFFHPSFGRVFEWKSFCERGETLYTHGRKISHLWKRKKCHTENFTRGWSILLHIFTFVTLLRKYI